MKIRIGVMIVTFLCVAGCSTHTQHAVGTEVNFLALRLGYLTNQAKEVCLNRGMQLNTAEIDQCAEQEWVKYAQTKEGREATYLAHQQDMFATQQMTIQRDVQNNRTAVITPTQTNCYAVGGMLNCYSH